MQNGSPEVGDCFAFIVVGAARSFRQRLDAAERLVKPGFGLRRKFFAKIQVHGGNSEPPGFRRMAENIAGQREHRARVGGVRHELRGLAGFKFAELNLVWRIHGGIHENNLADARNRVGVLGRKLLAHERAHAGQVQLAHRLGDARPDAVIAAQSVAVADDEQLGFDVDGGNQIHFGIN